MKHARMAVLSSVWVEDDPPLPPVVESILPGRGSGSAPPCWLAPSQWPPSPAPTPGQSQRSNPSCAVQQKARLLRHLETSCQNPARFFARKQQKPVAVVKVEQIGLVSGQQQTEIREELLLEILEIHQILEFAGKEV